MKKVYTVITVIMALALMTSGVYAAKKYTLQYKYEKGKVQRYEWAQKQFVTMTGMPTGPGGAEGGTMEVEMNLDGVVAYKTTAVLKDGTAAQEIKFERFDTQTNLPGGGPGAQLSKMMTSVGFATLVTKTGDIESFKIVGNANPMMADNELVKSIEQSLKNQPAFPKDGVSVGKSWTQTINGNLPLPGVGGAASLVTKATYTLKKIEKWNGIKNAAVFDLKANIAIDAPKDPGTGKPIMQGRGSFTGSMIFLIDQGVLATMNMKGTQTNTLVMPMGPGGNPVEMTQKINLEKRQTLQQGTPKKK